MYHRDLAIFKKGEKKSKSSSTETMVEPPAKEKSRHGFRHNKNETPQGEPVQPEKIEDKQYGEEYTMIVADTQVDGNKFLQIFDNKKLIK